ncbi:hypothetical protein SAMN05660909_04399 [Chitinophaga terrae (ex Kim and Jung 2007)]|uniref:Glutaminyl-peptide cyclotransferase n=1 Tax=Chitinophaga terrae (ex Kim and Jung 2007) TaxID=408074 RepID=A0A1H4FH90_9BACT|nr:hypothetical protein [Chitinophaga terrae (ex Kim and Jung 2007)]GEP92523.1 hypothetical protein CTE07_41680 [Chitinophaga terrae (ex Kim and Jung 2007)]SEA96753.1 hypothetical protein SAMN05660909_04399 [Chitinophaga terrae (ex Kim and Jung 2007)]
MKILYTILASAAILLMADRAPDMNIRNSYTLDFLGACQGISLQDGKYYLYGDREVGVMREYRLENNTLVYQQKEYRFTAHDSNIIKHPTGLAYHEGLPVFIGNSVRLNKEGTSWKALIYCINWEGFLKTGTLDGNLLNTIHDDVCIQGTRPEYVEYKGKWYVATADYGSRANEVRLYDPAALQKAAKTTESGVLVRKFKCSPWVQNLHWIANKGILVLIQNKTEGRGWRFTYLDLEQSIERGEEKVLKVVDLEKPDELEGFTLTNDPALGIGVSSSRKENISLLNLQWK